MTYCEEEKATVWIGLFIPYGEIGDRIVKGVGMTYEVVNYTSPTHTRERSEILTSLIYLTKNYKAREGQIFN